MTSSASRRRLAVEFPVGVLSQSGEWKRTGSRNKVVQSRVNAGLSDSIERARSICPACGSDAIEISIAGLDQTCIGPNAILRSAGGIEIVEHGQLRLLGLGELENDSAVVFGTASS